MCSPIDFNATPVSIFQMSFLYSEFSITKILCPSTVNVPAKIPCVRLIEIYLTSSASSWSCDKAGSSFRADVHCEGKVTHRTECGVGVETSLHGRIVNFNTETYEYSYSFNNPSLISKSHRLFYWNNVSGITNENHTGSFFIQQTD